MKLTKYNTALDLQKLTRDQIAELTLIHLDMESEVDHHYLNYQKGCHVDRLIFSYNKGRYETCTELYCRSLPYNTVDFDTFKSIHFPEPSSRRQEDDNDCPRYPLFKHMADEHGLTLLDSEMDDIAKVVRECYFSVPYEELVEALREVNKYFPVQPGDQETEQMTTLIKIEQLLERIK